MLYVEGGQRADKNKYVKNNEEGDTRLNNLLMECNTSVSIYLSIYQSIENTVNNLVL